MGQEEGDPSHLQVEERLQEASLPGGVRRMGGLVVTMSR